MPAHLSESIVSDYVQSRISPIDREAADRHTIECNHCMDQIVAAALSLRVSRRISKLLFEDGLREEEPEQIGHDAGFSPRGDSVAQASGPGQRQT